MSRLNGTDLAFIANHYEAVNFQPIGAMIYFCFDSKQSGEKAWDILKRVYKDSLNGRERYGIDKRDFYLGFNSKEVAANVAKEIQDSIASYSSVDPSTIDYVPQGAVDAGTETVTKKTSNTIIYIVAGAAVMIILLLWAKKKKK